MNNRFQKLIDTLPDKYQTLMNMQPVTVDTAPRNTPKGGVYLFSEGNTHLYAGRTKRLIRDRLKDHVCSDDDCPYAWHLAREKTGHQKATYKTEGSRKRLLLLPEFRDAYDSAKERIRRMDVRYVGESDPLCQALLEIYVAVESGARFNDFGTH